jgi:hypothetical protein
MAALGHSTWVAGVLNRIVTSVSQYLKTIPTSWECLTEDSTSEKGGKWSMGAIPIIFRWIASPYYFAA